MKSTFGRTNYLEKYLLPLNTLTNSLVYCTLLHDDPLPGKVLIKDEGNIGTVRQRCN